MKTLYISVLVLFFSANLSAQTVNQQELNQFYEKQQTPFLEEHAETFYLEGTSWERLYGEKEYVLTPLMQKIDEYFNRIQSLDEPLNGIYKSKFHFIKVEVNNFNKELLKDMNITVPDYIQNNVNVYLPEIDIDKLSEEAINFTYLTNYGKTPVKILNESNKDINAILFSEGFETYTVPGSIYSAAINGAANCGWKDKSCNPHTGSWSVYCAGTCAATCSSYVNDMNSQFWTTNFITFSNHTALSFNFWLNYDLYDPGSSDILYRSYNIGSGWQLSSFSYNATDPNDGAGWKYYSYSLSGNYTQYAFDFTFISNGFGNSTGVFIDDIELSGTPATGINEKDLANSISIYPNPTNGIFSIEADNMERIEITSITGEIVKALVVNKNKTTIDLTAYSSGIYFAKIITDKGNVTKKIILH